jgi:mono/diheme cytochrome c family protein
MWKKMLLGVVAVSGMLAVAVSAHAPGHDARGASAATREPVRITMEELHDHGGVPPGWRFTLPPGDPKTGREVFAKLECNTCHAVEGDFPPPPREPGNAGPELTGIGGHHPPEYIAESILSPDAVIVTGPGHTGPDGLSIMPSFADSLTVPELLDVVAYLASLTDGDKAHHDHHAGPSRPAQMVGDYHIRVAYHSHAGPHGATAKPAHDAQAPPGRGTPGHGGHGTEAPAAGQAKTPHAHDHLMVFVTDAKTGEPVPYLPVTVTIHAGKAPPRTVKLGPMVGSGGFHYGADVALPASTMKLTVTIGPTTMRVMPSAAGRFAGTARATFEWPR